LFISSSSRFFRHFHSPFSYLWHYILLNILHSKNYFTALYLPIFKYIFVRYSLCILSWDRQSLVEMWWHTVTPG
jgi:hypothetical protein